jgi:putative flippase GtrA
MAFAGLVGAAGVAKDRAVSRATLLGTWLGGWRAPLAFGIVGTVGFLVDAGVVTLLFNVLGVDRYSARLLSFATAVTVTWALNRSWTFRGSRHGSVPREYGLYVLAQSGGAAINFALYVLCVTSIAAMAELPAAAVAIGALGGMAFNYLSARHLVFRR